jgi:hypothetical protein
MSLSKTVKTFLILTQQCPFVIKRQRTQMRQMTLFVAYRTLGMLASILARIETAFSLSFCRFCFALLSPGLGSWSYSGNQIRLSLQK